MLAPGLDSQDCTAMPADCTIRAVVSAQQAIAQLRPAGGGVRVDCGAIQQADLTFVQLIASAQATFAARGVGLALDNVPHCVRSAFERAGVGLPPSAHSAPS